MENASLIGLSRQMALQRELDVIAKRLAIAYPRANKDYSVRLVGLREYAVRDVRRQLWLLVGAAACVLLIACANVGNLLLAHGSGRQLELATRIALGATRGHIVRQAMTEGLVLACIGGAAGIALATGLSEHCFVKTLPTSTRTRTVRVG